MYDLFAEKKTIVFIQPLIVTHTSVREAMGEMNTMVSCHICSYVGEIYILYI